MLLGASYNTADRETEGGGTMITKKEEKRFAGMKPFPPS
jgi:hypothetical protein